MMIENICRITLLSQFMIILMLPLHADQDHHPINEIAYQTNHYGDIFPIWQSIPEEELAVKLFTFVQPFKETRQAIILQIPHEKSSVIKFIHDAGFIFHHSDPLQSTWIFKNYSSIPQPFTTISGAHVMVLKDEKVLVLEERTRRGILGFPAGGTEKEELARETALRELYEEVGLHVQTEDLKLIALINRKRGNKEGANHLGHCFVTLNATGEVCIDPHEIVQAFWIPIKELAEATEINGLKVSSYHNALAKHILNGCRSSYFTQMQTFHPTSVVDSTDCMNVEFFQQNLSG